MPRFISERRAARHILAFLAAVLVGGCDLGEQAIAPSKPIVVMHGVLNPGASTQIVMLEWSRSGARAGADTLPSGSTIPGTVAGRIPVNGARVELTAPSGQVLTATEDRSNGRGNGMYRFALSGNSLVPGGTYSVHVRTAEGSELSAVTTVPNSREANFVIDRTFNRDGDTLVVQWNRIAGARSYLVRVESPHGPFFMFTDSTRVRMTGELRNLFADELPRLFVPGFQQLVSITAVDSNFYDYYRTQNDPFTGSGIISRVNGGIGLFGASVVIDLNSLDVVVAPKDPIEGLFVWAPSPGEKAPAALDMRIYVESRAVRADAASVLSGNYNAGGPPGTSRPGLMGSIIGQRVTIALLRRQSASDTTTVFSGELRGDSLIGTYPLSSQRRVYVRSR